MRIFLAIVTAIILGVALGIGIAALRIAVAPWNGDPGGIRQSTSVYVPTGQAAPRVDVDQERFDFGTLDLAAKDRHDFVFSNRGNATLQLSSERTSCRCTVSEIPNPTIEPGQSGVVTLTWAAEGEIGPYRQTATIETNDPLRPRVQLVVSGQIARTIRIVPESLVFGEVHVAQSETRQLRLLGYLESPLGILSCRANDSSTAEFFDVTFEPLSAEALQQIRSDKQTPAEEANVGEPEGPRDGYLIHVTLKPGLPLGTFRQTILIQTDQESVPTIEVPVAGTVVGDISIAGPGWDDRNGLLTLGTLNSTEETVRRLVLVVRGPHSKEVKFTLVRTVPDLIEVDTEALAQSSTLGDGTVRQTPLVIRIPKDSRPVDYLGPQPGEILLGTTHPDIPELRIRVRFAIKGG